MANLAKLQTAVAQAVLSGAPWQGAEALRGMSGLLAEQSLNIHRNNYQQGLVEALLGVFPITEAFVGKVFLAEAIRQFICLSPPRTPALFSYGGSFPEFLRCYGPAQVVPYLQDVATLEWLTHELMQEKEQKACGDIDTILSAARSGKLGLSRNARLLVSDFPIHDLWRAGTGKIDPSTLVLDGNSQAILLILGESQVLYQLLEPRITGLFVALQEYGRIDDNHFQWLSELMEQGVVAPKEERDRG